MFIIQPGQGLGFTGSREIAFGLGGGVVDLGGFGSGSPQGLIPGLMPPSLIQPIRLKTETGILDVEVEPTIELQMDTSAAVQREIDRVELAKELLGQKLLLIDIQGMAEGLKFESDLLNARLFLAEMDILLIELRAKRKLRMEEEMLILMLSYDTIP